MTTLVSAALSGMRGRSARALRRGGLAVLVTLLVNAGLFWSLAALHQLGLVGRRKAPRPAVAVTRIERPKRRKTRQRRRRRQTRQRSRRAALPALALPSAVQIPGFGGEERSATGAESVLHDKKGLDTRLLKSDEALDEALVDMPPKALYAVTPTYPPSAQRRGVEGKVSLRLLIGADGRVERVVVLAAQPKGVFERSATAAAQRMRFTPARIGSRAVRVWVRKTLSFALR